MGIKKDGTLLIANSGDPSIQPWTNWTDITEIVDNGNDVLFGLRSDGTVVRGNGLDQFLYGWENIKKLYAFMYGVVGLKADGTLEADFDNDGIEDGCDMQAVRSWVDTAAILPVDAGCFIAVKSDGTIL